MTNTWLKDLCYWSGHRITESLRNGWQEPAEPYLLHFFKKNYVDQARRRKRYRRNRSLLSPWRLSCWSIPRRAAIAHQAFCLGRSFRHLGVPSVMRPYADDIISLLLAGFRTRILRVMSEYYSATRRYTFDSHCASSGNGRKEKDRGTSI